MGLAHGVGLTPESMFWGLCACAEILLRIQLSIALFAAPLQRREHFVLRNVGWFCVLVMLYTAAFYLAGVTWQPESEGRLFQFGLFATLLVMCVPVVCRLFEASVWTSLFCCSAGYAIQNLSSGLTELLWLLARRTLALPALSDTVRSGTSYDLLTWIATATVYLACYLLVTRHANRRGLEQVSGRSMLGMMAVVVLMIIGLDLVIKGLCDQGMGLGYAVALRLAHACICIFTVWMEYELLINRRLTEERNTTERLFVEHRRQYETSRQNMEAINARVHDIRHAVMRTLRSAGTSLDTGTARELVREIDVFDAAVRTGNEALDTVLTQEQLVCRREGITLSCVADGASLGFIAPADLYTLFDMALGWAIATEKNVADLERRSISVVVRNALGVVSIHVECYMDGTCTEADTTLGAATNAYADSTLHSVVERYGGTLTFSAGKTSTQLDALFLPED